MFGEVLHDFQQFLNSWLEYQSRQAGIPGFSVSILYDDSCIFSHAYGYANAEFRVPLTTDHLFSMASQTKMFTAAAVLLLSQQGKLDVADRASEYLPWLRKHSDRRVAGITIQQLLNHSSGLAHDPEDASFWEFTESFPGPSKLRAIILASRAAPVPDGTPKYSNLGYCVLGEVISSVSRQPYVTFIQKNIIAPLQLSSTYTDYTARLARRMPNGYTVPYDQRRQAVAARQATKAMAPSVGIHTTTDDMCRFIAGVLSDSSPLLTRASQSLLQNTRATIAAGIDAGVTFGLGFRIKQVGGKNLLGHDGHLGGHVSATFYDPQNNVAVAVAANAQNAPIMQMVNGIFRAIQWFGEGEAPLQHKKRYDVRLRNRTGSMEVVTNGNRIVAVDPDSWDPFFRTEELSPMAGDKLRITTPGSLLNSGEVVKYWFANDVVKAVNFTGITMMQEAAYQGQELASATPSMAQHWLSLDELQYATLKVGRVIKTETRHGQFHTRILVDYGATIGVRYAFLDSLPHGVPASALLHKPVLGAVFTAWRFSGPAQEVLVLGLGMDQNVNIPFIVSSFLSLKPDPALPRTVWASDALPQIRHFADDLKVEAFKFQALPEYEQDECDSVYGDSFHAWQIGNINKSRALLRDERNEFWHKRVRHAIYHLIVTEDTPTPYQLWSIEFARRVAAPRGETVYTLPRKSLEDLRVPDGDFTIWDDRHIAVNGYSGIHWTHTTIHDGEDNGGDVQKFLDLKIKLLELVQQQGMLIR